MKKIPSLLILLACFVSLSGFGQETIYENIEVRIPLNNLGITSADELEVEIPVCKYDKEFAFTFTGDDALLGIYQRAFNYVYGRYVDDYHIFHGEGMAVTTGSTPERMLVHTDGCGNDIPFRLGVNWMRGGTIHNNGLNTSPHMWWSEGSRFADYYNGFMNHAGGDHTDPSEAILGNQNEIVENIGICPFVLGVPGSSTGFPEAGDKLESIYSMEAGSFTGGYPKLSDIEGDVLKKRFARICIDSKNLEELVKMLEGKTEDTRWINYFCHEIKNSDKKVAGQLNASDCFSFLDYMYDTYGKEGADNIWFASSPEVYEYLYSRLNSSLSKEIVDDELVIRIKAAVLPNFYFKDLSLKLSTKKEMKLDEVTLSDNVVRSSFASWHVLTPPDTTFLDAPGPAKEFPGISTLATLYSDGLLSDDSGQDDPARDDSVEIYMGLINLNFSEFPLSLADKYTSRYENNPTEENREEALYFIGMLREDKQAPFTDRLTLSALETISRDGTILFEMAASRDLLYFTIGDGEEYEITLYTLSGLPVKKSKINANSLSLEIGDLPSGVYTVTMRGNQNTVSGKIVR